MIFRLAYASAGKFANFFYSGLKNDSHVASISFPEIWRDSFH
jgi:hypothetical protein